MQQHRDNRHLHDGHDLRARPVGGPVLCARIYPSSPVVGNTLWPAAERRRSALSRAAAEAMPHVDPHSPHHPHGVELADSHKTETHVGSPRKRRERDHRSTAVSVGSAVGSLHRHLVFGGRVEARSVAFVGMFFVTLTAASLYSLLAPFFPTVAGACGQSWAQPYASTCTTRHVPRPRRRRWIAALSARAQPCGRWLTRLVRSTLRPHNRVEGRTPRRCWLRFRILLPHCLPLKPNLRRLHGTPGAAQHAFYGSYAPLIRYCRFWLHGAGAPLARLSPASQQHTDLVFLRLARARFFLRIASLCGSSRALAAQPRKLRRTPSRPRCFQTT